ncbi:MAG: metalloregulator ArsR/SmtB family transcription factor [Geobacter sp.]|nr:metalloregulator ArsR/SmtB family transcription factor [Geobacter sp.]
MKNTVKLFKSLSDETRLRILFLLLEHGELCICDLMTVLEQPQSTVSRHVAYLKNSGWLHDRRGGVWMYYSIRPGLSGLFAELSTLIRSRCAALPECAADQVRLLAYKQEKNCI